MCTRGTCSRAVRRVCLTSARQPTSTTLGLNRSTTVRRRVRAAGAWARGSATACAHGIQHVNMHHTTYDGQHTKPTLARAYTLAQPAWPHPLCSHLPDFTHHKTIATVACVLREQRARCVPTQLRANPCYQQHAVTHACDRLAITSHRAVRVACSFCAEHAARATAHSPSWSAAAPLLPLQTTLPFRTADSAAVAQPKLKRRWARNHVRMGVLAADNATDRTERFQCVRASFAMRARSTAACEAWLV